MSSEPIFRDESGRRARKSKAFLIWFGGIIAIISTAFALSLLSIPLPRLLDGKAVSRPPIPVPKEDQNKAAFLTAQTRRDLRRIIDKEKKSASEVRAFDSAQIVGAYYAVWQENGLHSLKAHGSQISHLFPEWLHLSANGTDLDTRDWDPELNIHNQEVVQFCRSQGIGIHVLLNNSSNRDFEPERAHKLLNDEAAMDAMADKIVAFLTLHKFQGLHVDFEALREPDYQKLPIFLSKLRAKFDPLNLDLSIALEVDKPYIPYADIADECKFVVVMGYDEHAGPDDVGPIASIGFTDKVVEKTLKDLPNEKVVMGVGNYGYDWNLKRPSEAPEALTFQETIQAAKGYRPEEKPRDVIELDSKSLNPYFEYYDDNKERHRVWFLDAVTLHNQLVLAGDAKLRGAAMWLLGSEDPSVWSVFDRKIPFSKIETDQIKTIRYPYEVDFVGKGEILTIKSQPQDGARAIEVDKPTRLITDSNYTTYASSYVFQREGYKPKSVVLTFDDGPDPQWTPKILDALKELGIQATFFVVGENAEKYPDLVSRMVAEGHEVGNHTYTHPHMGYVSDLRAELEVNATQRAIQTITGRSTTLFRPPFNADAEPSTKDEVKPFELASKLGYLSVGEVNDPQDWNLFKVLPDGTKVKRTAREMADAVLAQLKTKDGTVVLLHDAGGDRSATVEALRLMVPELTAAGYKFETTGALANLTFDQVMPPISKKDLIIVGLDRFFFATTSGISNALSIFFVLAIGIGLLRVVMLIPLAIAHKKRADKQVFDPEFTPTVSALVAAYNEEKVVVQTVGSILNNNYPNLQVVVVDDGSKDKTTEVLQAAYAGDPRVTLIRQENGGKASALNTAIAESTGEILFCVDADTQLSPDAIKMLVRHFQDPEVGAVAGNVKVGNWSENILTRWQSVEYTTSQNLDRRAYAQLNCVSVVPGAIGAWKKDAVVAVGAYTTDTLAEDMDLTWRIRLAGYKIETESESKAYTEAPDGIQPFFKQRFRWAFGVLQVLWKHRKATGKYGWFGRFLIPTQWLFQVIFQVFAPLIDLKLLVAVVMTTITLVELKLNLISKEVANQDRIWNEVGLFAFLYGLFFAVELISGSIAYRMEKEKATPLLWLFLQRFVYRQIMYGVVIKSLWQAVIGRRQGWGKLARKASVNLPQ